MKPGDALVAAMSALDAAGLNSGTSGNLSLRDGNGMLITPTGIGAERLRVDQIVPMDLQGDWQGDVRPSSEWAMHAAIYRSFPDAMAVIHAHPDHCVALSCLRRPLPAFHYMIASFGGDDVRCSRYEPFGSQVLGEAAVEALQGRNACLLANHGMICFGPDLDMALSRTIKLETLARQYAMACAVGEPVLLDAGEMEEVKRRYRGYGQQSLGGS